jgi:predicted secreted protein
MENIIATHLVTLVFMVHFYLLIAIYTRLDELPKAKKDEKEL